MSSNIDAGGIDDTYPVAGKQNSSQGFRDNFSYIKQNFQVAKDELSHLLSIFPQGASSSIIPQQDGADDLGSVENSWRNIYASNEIYADVVNASSQIRSSFIRSDEKADPLRLVAGTTLSNEGARIFLYGLEHEVYPGEFIIQSLNQTATGYNSLVGNSNGVLKWNSEELATKSYVDSAALSGGGSVTLSSVTSSIIPNSNNSYDLGSSTAAWKDIYASGIATLGSVKIGTSTTAITGIDTDLSTTSTADDTVPSAKAVKAYVDAAALSGGGSVTLSSVTSSIIPSSNNTNDLGSSTAAWKDIYASGIATLGSVKIGTSTTAITGIDTDLSTISTADDTVPSAKAVKAYVDATAEDVKFISLDFDAVIGTRYILNSSNTSITLTLPAEPERGDTVSVTEIQGNNSCIIARNGEMIMGLAEDLTLDIGYVAVTFVYAGQLYGWVFA